MQFLWIVVVAQLAVGIVGLATVDPDDDAARIDTTASTTTTTAAGAGSAGPATTTKPGRPTTTGAQPTTTAGPTTTATAAAQPAGKSLTPARAGVYEYRNRYTDDEGTEETKGRYSYSAAREEGGEVRQTVTEVEDEVTTTLSFAWRADGLYLRAANEDGEGCNMEPDVLLVPSALTIGRQWKIDSSCTVAGEPIRLQATSRLARTERITVAGRQVDTYVIETKIAEDEENEGLTSLQFFSPERGLVVRDDTTYDDGTTETEELLNLDPK